MKPCPIEEEVRGIIANTVPTDGPVDTYLRLAKTLLIIPVHRV